MLPEPDAAGIIQRADVVDLAANEVPFRLGHSPVRWRQVWV